MLCQNCSKKDATSIFLPPNQTKLMYLCGACYKILNNNVELENLAAQQAQNLNIEENCRFCGLKYNDFKNSGLFGCAECYNTFSDYINQNFLQMFKEKKYLGKKPNLYYVQQEIKNLEHLIEMCLTNGNFQKATKYGKELEKLKEQSYGKL